MGNNYTPALRLGRDFLLCDHLFEDHLFGSEKKLSLEDILWTNHYMAAAMSWPRNFLTGQNFLDRIHHLFLLENLSNQLFVSRTQRYGKVSTPLASTTPQDTSLVSTVPLP